MVKKDNERINHFSIRKLSIGAASVLLSTTLYFGVNISNSTVHAAEETTNTSTIPVTDNTNPAKESSIEPTSQLEQTTQDQNNKSTLIQQKNVSTEKVENKVNQDNTSVKKEVTKPSANIIYAGSTQNVQVNGWFKVEVNSGTLTNIPQGSSYQIAIGQNLPLNYNRLDINIPKFSVTNNGEGVFDVTADGDYTNASFDIIASMSYIEPISANKTITLPVTITHNGQTTNLDTQVNITPEPKKTESEAHPLIYYKCFGLNPQTNRISWGVYVNYNEEELKDVDISAVFNGDQQLVKDSIAVYAPTQDELGDGINTEKYPDNTYNYDLSAQMQKESTSTSVKLQQAGPFVVDGKNYSKQPLYIYFQTQLPSSANVSSGEGLSKYSSVLNLKASGIAVHTPPTSPAASGNGGQADGENIPVAVSETKSINETINYLYEGTNKTAAPQYKAVPITFTRTGEKNVVTGKVTWGKWSADESFKAVTSPTIKGYTADKKVIASQSVNPDSKDLVFDVYYTKNAPTKVSETRTINETINYLYEGTNKTAAPQYKAVPITFTRTGEKDAVTDKVTWGKWSADESFKAVTSPTIKGYTVDKKVVTSQSVNPDSKDLEFDVYYTKNAPTKVSESRTINEIINYLYEGTNKTAAPQYKAVPITFTRTGEKDAVTGKVTWGKWSADENFKAVTSPTLKGYTADKKVIASQSVNPDSKDLVFNVYYSKNEQTSGTVLLQDDDVINETIKYIYADSGLQAAPTYKNAIGFTREGISNGKTTTWKTWSPENRTFEAVTSPNIAGYTVSKKVVNAIAVKPGDKDIEVTIYYTPIPDPTPVPNPEPTPQPHPQPTPTSSSNPGPTPDVSQPHAAITSEENTKVIVKQPNKSQVIAITTGDSDKKDIATQVQGQKNETLPQTGSQRNELGLIGLGISLVATMLSLIGFNKKKEH